MGALQLLPENADHLPTLEAVAAGMGLLSPASAGRGLTRAEWGRLAQGALLATDTPPPAPTAFEHPFAEAFTFHGGSYVVLPGLADEVTFILRQLARVFLLGPGARLPPAYRQAAGDLFLAALLLSDEVARRAGLVRGVAPLGSDRPVVPSEARFRRLRDAVRFEPAALAALLAPAGLDYRVLAPLTLDRDPESRGPHRLDPRSPLAGPIVRVGDRHVVVAPCALLRALRHGLVRLAVEHGVTDALAAAFREANFRSVVRSVDEFLGCRWLPVPALDHGALPVDGAFFSLDRDKIVHAALLTDGLEGYDPDDPFGEWEAAGSVFGVLDHLRAVEDHVFRLAPAGSVNEMLHLVVVQGIGRAHGYPAVGRVEPTGSPWLAMSAADLETFGLREGGSPLALWQFATAALAARETTAILRTGLLDELEYYRSRDRSYYHGHGLRLTLLVIEPGGGGSVYREVRERFDIHGVPDAVPGQVVEVARLHRDGRLPTYVPFSSHDTRVAFLSEALPVPVWILGPDDVPDPRLDRPYRLVAEALAYWLWQAAPSVGETARGLVGRLDHLRVDLRIAPEPGWFEVGEVGDEASPPQGPPVVCEVEGDGLLLRLEEGARALLETADNAGERELLRVVLRAVSRLAEGLAGPRAALPDARIEAALDRHAPLGPKKMLVLGSTRGDPRLDGRDLPPLRELQAADEHAVLDDLGAFVAGPLGLPIGSVEGDRRLDVLRDAVGYLFGELERLVATLDPAGLLDQLVALNERIVHEQATRRLTTPTRLACYATEPEMVEALGRELPELSQAVVASRFLIEYVAARPPRGLRPFGLAVHDRLAALADEIVHWSFASEEIRWKVADVGLALLPSGRLGLDRDAYEAARRLFVGDYAHGEVARSRADFAGHWGPRAGRQAQDDLDRMEPAAAEEFGLPFRDLLAFLRAAVDLGDRQPGAAKRASVAALADGVAAGLGWPRERADRAIDLFAVRPRERFLAPPRPDTLRDVVPWNFGRPYSYLRKPLLVRAGADGDEEVVWGNRNLYLAGAYLYQLCVEGRLQARTPGMKALVSRLQQARSAAFNRDVAALFAARPGVVVRTQVKKVGRSRIERAPGEDLGDIDVLAADPGTRRIIAAELKDLAAARTPSELGQELDAIFRTDGGRKAAVDKHMERTAWLAARKAEVLEGLGLPSHDADQWRIEPLLVLDVESMSPYLVDPPVRVVTYERLREELGTAKELP